ncbi:MAG: V-type ATP synthase subunit D [Acidobacteria bacterium]|nr:V-type ATP synthase subunit D [Acidobacteriota bacterium]
MIQAAGRLRLLELRRERGAARAGRELLDRKREAILRTMIERVPRRDQLRRMAVRDLAAARRAMADAQCELGRTAVAAAALAQPEIAPLAVRETTIVGVALPRVEAAITPFRPRYGSASGSDRLDAAGAAFTALVPGLLAFTSEEMAVRRLRAALARTVRRLNALDTLVLPELSRQIHIMAAALEEEERDEAVRRRQWLSLAECASTAGPGPRAPARRG